MPINFHKPFGLHISRQVITPALDFWRSKTDVGEATKQIFLTAKQTSEYHAVFEKSEPLVSICIATYNRAQLLCERALPSILSQTYENFEVIVVGDNCTDDTAERVAGLKDKRVMFENLPNRLSYPVNPVHRWMVAGTPAANFAMRISAGDFITHLDDDDAYSINRIAELIAFVKKARVDVAWHPFFYETVAGSWHLNKANEFSHGSVTTSSIFYHRWFKRIRWDINAWKLDEPGDWNRCRKFRFLGAKLGRASEPLLWHFKERNQSTK